MPTTFLEKLAAMFTPRPPLDPARFNDPLALQTEWKPLKGGGTNFRTHDLTPVGTMRVEFRASLGARIFYGIFAVAGGGVTCAAIKWVISGKDLDWGGLLFLSGLGLVFLSIGVGMWWFGTVPIVFDRQAGWFWRSRQSPAENFDPGTLKNCVELKDIHALQIVSERCSGSKGSSYYSYELNLVLGDGRRVNVVDHGDLNRLRLDAAALSLFLGKPLWDGTA